ARVVERVRPGGLDDDVARSRRRPGRAAEAPGEVVEDRVVARAPVDRRATVPVDPEQHEDGFRLAPRRRIGERRSPQLLYGTDMVRPSQEQPKDRAGRPVAGQEVDDVVDAVLRASRVLVSVAARSLAGVSDTVTLPQYRALVVL